MKFFRLPQAIPFLLLPFDSLTGLLGLSYADTSQVLPLSACYAPFYLANKKFCFVLNKSQMHSIFLVCMIFILMLLLTFVNSFRLLDDPVKFAVYSYASARQIVSYIMGVMVYIMFIDLCKSLPLQYVARYSCYSFFPVFLVTVFQLYSGEYRLVGYSTEPSHFANYLVFVLVPFSIIYISCWHYRFAFIGLVILVLFLTFSSTGYIKAIVWVLLFYALKGHVLKSIFIVAISVALIFFTLQFFTDNYASRILSILYASIESGDEITNASFVDRFYGAYSPFIHSLTSINGFLGYGFGGDSIFFPEIFPAQIVEIILSVKGETVSVGSMQSKIVMYGGVLSCILFYMVLSRSCRYVQGKSPIVVSTLVSLYLISFASNSQFNLPYIWLWLAIAITYRSSEEVVHMTDLSSKISNNS